MISPEALANDGSTEGSKLAIVKIKLLKGAILRNEELSDREV